MKHKKQRIILLYTKGNLGSTIVLNMLSIVPELEIVGIVQSPAVPANKGYKTVLKKHLKNMGWRFSWLVVWQRFIQLIGHALAYIIPSLRRGTFYRRSATIIKDHHIPVFTGDINSKKAQEFIKQHKPDILVSAYFNQILKEDVIALPPQGVLNIHPGYLPAYRGVMGYFWALKNKEDCAGVSLHWIDAGIDTGALIAQRKISIKPNTTQHQLHIKSAIIGTIMLRSALKKIRHKHPLPTVSIHDRDISYYTLPKEQDFEHYMQHRRFFRIRDMIAFLLRPISKKLSP